MRGFTDRALVLLSDLDDYADSGSIYKFSYKQALENLFQYLGSVGIEHDCLLTDALATHMDMHRPRWLATAVPEDMFYMRNYCGVPAYEAVELPADLATKVRTKYPIARGMSPADRFQVVSKRVKLVEKALIDSYSFVVVFGDEFKVHTKENDGRAVLRVNAKKFYTRMELSGMEVPINDFLQVPYANLCLCDWGKFNGNDSCTSDR